MTFLTLKDAYGSELNIKVESLDSFADIGGYRQLIVNGESYSVKNTMSEIKSALSECYCTVKTVELHEST